MLNWTCNTTMMYHVRFFWGNERSKRSIWPNGIIFHQPTFPWNKGSHFPSKKLPFGAPKLVWGRGLIWPDQCLGKCSRISNRKVYHFKSKGLPWHPYIWLGLSPLPGCNRDHQEYHNIFRVGDPNLNLHLPQELLGGGTTQGKTYYAHRIRLYVLSIPMLFGGMIKTLASKPIRSEAVSSAGNSPQEEQKRKNTFLLCWCICVMVKSRVLLGMGDLPPEKWRNPYNGYINPYYWVDDHPLLYGNNGSLDPGTYVYIP